MSKLASQVFWRVHPTESDLCISWNDFLKMKISEKVIQTANNYFTSYPIFLKTFSFCSSWSLHIHLRISSKPMWLLTPQFQVSTKKKNKYTTVFVHLGITVTNLFSKQHLEEPWATMAAEQDAGTGAQWELSTGSFKCLWPGRSWTKSWS
jgi:hypothetical protein